MAIPCIKFFRVSIQQVTGFLYECEAQVRKCASLEAVLRGLCLFVGFEYLPVISVLFSKYLEDFGKIGL
ncbi:hypothetical protein QQG55_7825 [Brugia pahangi]